MIEPFSYELPQDRIAQVPLADRASSKLLVLHRQTGEISHHSFRDCVDFFRAGDTLVVNDTRVSALRILGHRETGGKVELLLLDDLGNGRFRAMAKPAKRIRAGTKLLFEAGLSATVDSCEDGGLVVIDFSESPSHLELISSIGQTPLPPYIRQALSEPERYQTVYAAAKGSAAAPTAGLHFTRELMETLQSRDVTIATVTLDVSLDTFRPIQVQDISAHVMHGENCRITPEEADKINSAKGRIVAVGTTAVRTLESFAVSPRCVESGEKSTTLFITPGYEFQIVDAMFTNFHLPKTTMLLMLAAFGGSDNVKYAYQCALGHDYRFLSFGDSMLIF